MHGIGRHQPAESRRKHAKTETPLIKYSLERGALGSQKEEAALGAGVGGGGDRKTLIMLERMNSE